MPRMTIHAPRRGRRRATALEPGTGYRVPGTGRRLLGPRSAGFTLIELIVVMAIIGILATIAVPAMRTAPIRARESALKEDLYQIRSCIDQFHADRDRYPTSLEELVEMGYLRAIPIDPVTKAADWVTEVPEITGEETEVESEAGAGSGIIDVRSASDQDALDGSRYSDW
jgi:general secretion pathway protein G